MIMYTFFPLEKKGWIRLLLTHIYLTPESGGIKSHHYETFYTMTHYSVKVCRWISYFFINIPAKIGQPLGFSFTSLMMQNEARNEQFSHKINVWSRALCHLEKTREVPKAPDISRWSRLEESACDYQRRVKIHLICSFN